VIAARRVGLILEEPVSFWRREVAFDRVKAAEVDREDAVGRWRIEEAGEAGG